jgi:hypothetical protein
MSERDDYLAQLSHDTASNLAIQPRSSAPGAVAAQDSYTADDAPAPAWLMNTLGQQMNYEPQGTMWPDPNAVPKARTPVPGDPDYQWAIGQWAAPLHGATQAVGEMAPSMLWPGGRLGMATQMAMDTDEAQAGKLKGAGKAMGEILGLANPRLRTKAEALFGKYPQYAEAYPPIGPPELMSKLPDPKNPGKFLSKADAPVPYTTLEEALAKDAEPGFFLEKKLTPEVEQFQKDRNVIQQEMDLHGYEPYFDPAKRFDVNPKFYGPFEDTATTAAPKTAKTQAEWSEKYGTDEIRARLRAGFERGMAVPESDRWYHMGQLEKEYIKELGAKEGRAAFKGEFADMMAATTGGASPYDNFLMSHYANVMNKAGERLPERSYNLPFPIGGRFASGNIAQAQKYIDQGNAAWPVGNPKRYDFSSAYLGNKNAGTIDEQMMTAFDPTLKAKQPVWYGPATQTLRQEAAKAGVDTRGFQDVGWAGLKGLKEEAAGKVFNYEGPMINQINRSIETTHRLTGMPREEIVRRGLIRKEIPMYGLAGATTMGALADQGNYPLE